MRSTSEGYEIPGTDKTPRMEFRPGEGLLAISGCSVPEDADRFFSPLCDLVEGYADSAAARTLVRVELSYFNSSSAKYLLDIFKRLEDIHASGASQVTLEWRFAQDDLDMREAGMDYRSLLEFPVKLVESGA